MQKTRGLRGVWLPEGWRDDEGKAEVSPTEAERVAKQFITAGMSGEDACASHEVLLVVDGGPC